MNSSYLSIPSSLLIQEFHDELIAIANWWVKFSIDNHNGGFYGEIKEDNQPIINANKGVILNTRILWFFSEAARETGNPLFQQCAERAFTYLINNFFDKDFGGVYWELDAIGNPINTRKQTYAQAFAIYALSSYYELTGSNTALFYAKECFNLIEKHAIDGDFGGYLEAFSRDWSRIDDLRLSDKDLNLPKSQNTHLHILEAYTTFYKISPHHEVKRALRYTIEVFDKYFINRDTYHLKMFMNLDWSDHSPGVTYGHDIEAAWLIAKALESLDDQQYRLALTPTLIKIADTIEKEAIGDLGQVLDAYSFSSGLVSNKIVWWVQAEALVGFLYAYKETNDIKYFLAAERLWDFIKHHQIDRKNGEWLWLAKLNNSNIHCYKAGFWKCPYHNGRAMIEGKRYLHEIVSIAKDSNTPT